MSKLKHVKHGPCPLCSEWILQGHPEIQRVWPLLKLTFPHMHVSWVFRDQVTQDQLVAKGASDALWPKSNHNKMDKKGKPCARAFDLFSIGADGVPRWEAAKFKLVAEWLIANKWPLRIPYPLIYKDRNGKPRIDWPHFELSKEVPQP